MNIGIGIPTYNRLELLKKTIKSIEKNADMPYDLFVSIDGSEDGTLEWIKPRYEYHMQQRQGVCFAKNAILKRFKDYDYIFMIEDDMLLRGRNTFALYIKAIKCFNIQHFNFLLPHQRIPVKPNKIIGDMIVMFSSIVGGAVSIYTKEVIRKVGGFNPKFKGYGHGHCEYTLRIARAGLTSPWRNFAHLVNAENYFSCNAIKNATIFQEIEEDEKRNSKILKKSLEDKNLIYIPLC